MTWPAMAAATVLLLAQVGCDKIPFLGKESDTAETATATPAQPAQPPAEAAPVAAQPEPEPEPAPEPERAAAPPLVDEPWEPIDTGTVRSGMTRMEVITVWGVPVAERTVGIWTYLYFRNGCEVTCGTFDVVFLEHGQVIDAIVRGPGHNYAGVSSSPPDREAEFTPPRPPGGTMGADE